MRDFIVSRLFRGQFFSSALLALTASLAGGAAIAQTVITVVNNDAAGEGFNDGTAVAPVAGNAGTTLGQQRLIAFQAAADAWEGVVQSSVEIRVGATMDPMTPCTATSGILGSAGTAQVFRDFTSAPLANTWYSGALANAISGSDNSPGTDDITARFNSDVDNAACLGTTNWFYGLGVPTPAGSISFFETLKHELGHGLGVQSFVSVATTGELLSGRNDAFTNHLHDHSTGEQWPVMTNAERLASAIDTGDLHWTGPQVNGCAASILTAGMSGGHVQMFAPNPVQPGSSVSHFDTAVTPDELMEPFATTTSDQRLTDRLLADIGWNVTSPTCGRPHDLRLSLLTHDLRISGIHNIIPSRVPVHPTRLSLLHFPIGSNTHIPALSDTHFPIGSTGHLPFLSGTHFPVVSNRHNLVSSRFGFDPSDPVINPGDPFGPFDPRFPRGPFGGGFDPRMPFDGGMDPFGGQMRGFPGMEGGGGDAFGGGSIPAPFPHNSIASFGHSPVLSFGHDPFSSSTHRPFVSVAHDGLTSQTHDSFLSRQHDAFRSLGHSPFFSFGHTSLLSFGHIPSISFHSPVLSNPHNPIVSRQHFLVPSAILEGGGPVLDPGLMGTMPGMGGAESGIEGGGGAMPMPDGREFIPGNRTGVDVPPTMPIDPYTVPQR